MNKKYKILGIIALFVMVLTACNSNAAFDINAEPNIVHMKNIADLATVEAYFNNVVDIEQKSPGGIRHIFEKDRKLWIEYKAKARLGIDLNKLNIDINRNNIDIEIPPAEILGQITPDLNSRVYYASQDSIINKNEITKDTQDEKLRESLEELEKTIMESEYLLSNAQLRTRKLIENYINQISEISGNSFTINWKYLDNQGNVVREESFVTK